LNIGNAKPYNFRSNPRHVYLYFKRCTKCVTNSCRCAPVLCFCPLLDDVAGVSPVLLLCRWCCWRAVVAAAALCCYYASRRMRHWRRCFAFACLPSVCLTGCCCCFACAVSAAFFEVIKMEIAFALAVVGQARGE